jgi:hypothetical protein
MIYKRLLLIIMMPFLMALSCEKNEFGPDSIFYYLNGEPTIPTCFNSYSQYVEAHGDSLTVYICGSPNITYKIKNFNGKGRYTVNAVNQNTCNVSFGYNDEYNLPVDDKTYLYVLDLDTLKRHFEAVFEAELKNEFNQSISITKGRMDINY